MIVDGDKCLFLNSRSQETIHVLLLLVISEMPVPFACDSLNAGNVSNFIGNLVWLPNDNQVNLLEAIASAPNSIVC